MTLSRAEILREIQQMMKELFQIEEGRVQPDVRLAEDLDLDSLDAIDLAVKVEETTGLTLTEAVLIKLRTVQDVIVAVEALMIANPGAARTAGT